MKALSLFLPIALLFACNLSYRLNVDRIVSDAEKIRDGETKFRGNHARYATLGELALEQLVDERVVDGKDAGFFIDLGAQEDNYRLSIYPDYSAGVVKKDDEEQLSIYCDGTGVLRAAFDPNKHADQTSSEMHPKH